MGIGADGTGGAALVAGQVEALAADTGDNHQGSIIVAFVAGLHLVGVLALGSLGSADHLIAAGIQVAGVGSPGSAGCTVVIVKFLQCGVCLESRILQAGIQVTVSRGIKAAGAGTAIGQVHAVLAENRNLCILVQRERIFLIFQKDKTLLRQTEVQLLGVGISLVLAGHIGDIHGFHAVVIDGALAAKHNVHETAEHTGDQDVCHNGNHQHQGSDNAPHRYAAPGTDFLHFLLFHGMKLHSFPVLCSVKRNRALARFGGQVLKE